MNFDKNTVIGIVLIIFIFVGFSYYNVYEQEQYLKTHPKTAKQASKYPVKDTLKAEQAQADTTKVADIQQDSIAQTSITEGSFASFTKGSEQLVTIENEDCIYTFSNKGGIIKKVELKNYKTFQNTPLILFENNGDDFNFSFITNDSKTPVQTGNLFFATTTTSQKISGTQQLQINYTINLGNGKTYVHTYTLNGKGYVLDFAVQANKMADVLAANQPITLNWKQNLPAQEGGIEDERYNSSIYYMNDVKEDDNLTRDKEETLEAPLKWISYKQKFFNTSIIAEQANFKKEAQIKVVTPKDNNKIVKTFTSQLQLPYNNSNTFSFPMKLFMGPNQYDALKKMDVELTDIIPLGWSILGLINKFFIIPIFHFLSKFISNYGINILILAIIIKLVTYPFTFKSTLSMAKMKVLKPELDELKKKYPNQAEFGQKQMELYSQTGVSPFGGCLPMLLQMPILIAMYRLFPSSIELRQQPFLWATDLSSYDSIISWSSHIPVISTLFGNHISLFTILMSISSVVVTKMTSQMQPAGGMGGEGMMAQQMKMMQYLMPVMLLFMFNKQPAALSYYYFLFNVLTFAQNWLIQKFYIDEDAIRAQIEINKKKPKKQSAFQQKMQDMIKQQQEVQKNRKK
ncbi:MAG: membrane protein insertase YidC [Chitinophagales bacterium]|nr:membrane protein insertase YidC [Bacteroidota bacterium]